MTTESVPESISESSMAPFSVSELQLLRERGASSAEVASAGKPQGPYLRAKLARSGGKVPRRAVRLGDGRFLVSYDTPTLTEDSVVEFRRLGDLYDAHSFIAWGFSDDYPRWSDDESSEDTHDH